MKLLLMEAEDFGIYNINCFFVNLVIFKNNFCFSYVTGITVWAGGRYDRLYLIALGLGEDL